MKIEIPNLFFGIPPSLKQPLYSCVSITLLLVIACTSFSQPLERKNSKHLKQKQSSAGNKQVMTYQIIASAGKTFGYDILQNKHKLIHQPSKPGLQGNSGFASKADAIKVAKLVISKIKNNQMPPTVSRYEMDSLKVKL